MSTDTLDVLIVGGGPAGTATAFRCRELGLDALVIDFDDILKRIRDYPADKLILPDFGGGDRMSFPAAGELIAALQFEPIDKDEICARWKALYAQFGLRFRTGVELTGVTRNGDEWEVGAWDHREGAAALFRARHVVIAVGRGVPRRFDIPGNTDGIAYRLDDPSRYTSGPVLVLGGGTSAAEAVVAISHAKVTANDACAVYWSYRGTKMPRVSKALAEQFFEAYIGNGNIRHFPESEPVAVVTGPDRAERLSLRVDRKTPEGRPPETVHLEFTKTNCIACIGEDIPEALLQTLGIPLVVSPATGKKVMAVTPLLETRQPHIYLIGDLLSQSYLEVDDFAAPPETYRQVKHRGNIKTALRDGVFVAEVIRQRIDGRAQVDVVLRDAPHAGSADPRVSAVLGLHGEDERALASAAEPPATPAAFLVTITPVGVEAGEYPLRGEGTTTIGSGDADICFPQDSLLATTHASISLRDDAYFLRDDGSRSGTWLRALPERPVVLRTGDLLRAGRQILVLSERPGDGPSIEQYDAAGHMVAEHPLKGTLVFGRSGGRSDPDVVLDNSDMTLSRFHMSIALEGSVVSVQDFGSRNGTYVKVDSERPVAHGDRIRVGSQQLEIRLHDLPEKKGSERVPVRDEATGVFTAAPPPPALAPASAAPVPPAPASSSPVSAAQAYPVPASATPLAPVPAPTPDPSGPTILFRNSGIGGPIDPAQSLLAWADEHNVPLDYECWIGMCGCDAIRVISGAEFLNDPTEKEVKTLKRKGLEPGPCRLACMARATGPVVVEPVE